MDLDRQRGCWQSEKSTIVVLLRVKLKLERRLLTLADQWIELVLLLLLVCNTAGSRWMWKEPREGKEVSMRKRRVSRIPISEGLATNSSLLPIFIRLSGVATSLAP